MSWYHLKLSLGLPLIAVLCIPASVCAEAPQSDAGSHFDRLVAPLLARHCLDCHSGAKPKAGLDMTTPDPYRALVATFKDILDQAEALIG